MSCFGRAFKSVTHFIGRKIIPGISKAAHFIGTRILPVASKVLSNPLVQAVAAAALGPEVSPAMMAGSAAAGFGAHAYQAGQNTIRTAQNVMASARRGDVNGAYRGAGNVANDLATLHNTYKGLRSQ